MQTKAKTSQKTEHKKFTLGHRGVHQFLGGKHSRLRLSRGEGPISVGGRLQQLVDTEATEGVANHINCLLLLLLLLFCCLFVACCLLLVACCLLLFVVC